MLQLADCYCSALFKALKYCDNIHFGYEKKKKDKIYQKNNNLLSYGMKLVPSDSDAQELKKLISFINI